METSEPAFGESRQLRIAGRCLRPGYGVCGIRQEVPLVAHNEHIRVPLRYNLRVTRQFRVFRGRISKFQTDLPLSTEVRLSVSGGVMLIVGLLVLLR
jgi:hypothetical protein